MVVWCSVEGTIDLRDMEHVPICWLAQQTLGKLGWVGLVGGVRRWRTEMS